MIQHAWSAVSHALQYKQEAGIPAPLRRRLNRIAGLFELADEQFVAIRKDREQLEQQIRRDIKSDEASVPINTSSISEFMSAWKGREVLHNQALQIGFDVQKEMNDDSDITSIIYDIATLAGISDVAGLRNALETHNATYLQRLLQLQRESFPENTWTVSDHFLVVLVLVYYAADRIDSEFLIAKGYYANLAEFIVRAAKETNKKANRQSSVRSRQKGQ